MSNYYKQLGIPIDAEPEEIELAYEAVHKLIHTQNELEIIDIAYQTLRDPVLRVQYDQQLLAETQQTDLVLPNVKEQVAKAQKQMATYKELYGQLMQEHQQRMRLSAIVSALSGMVILLVLVLINRQRLWLTGLLLWLGEITSAFFLLSFLGLFSQARFWPNLFNVSWRWGLYFGLLVYVLGVPIEWVATGFLNRWLPLLLLTVIPHFLLSLEVIRSNITKQHELDKKQFFKLHAPAIERATLWLEYDNSFSKTHWRIYEDDSFMIWTREDKLMAVFWVAIIVGFLIIMLLSTVNNFGLLLFFFVTFVINMANILNKLSEVFSDKEKAKQPRRYQ